MVSRSMPMVSSTVATTKPVRSLPAKQCVSTGRPSASSVTTRCRARCAPLRVGNAGIRRSCSGRRPRSPDVRLAVGMPRRQQLLKRGLVRRLAVGGRRHARSGNGSRWMSTPSGTSPGPRRATSRRRAQVGDIGDAELAQRRPAVVVEPAQLAGPEQPARPQRRSPRRHHESSTRPTVPAAPQSCEVTAAANADCSPPISARAMVRMCTSSGPSKIRMARCQPYSRASAVSSLTPAAPCTWIARSMTSQATCGATALICETSRWAALLPCWSMVHAAFSHSSRAWSISLRDLAIAAAPRPARPAAGRTPPGCWPGRPSAPAHVRPRPARACSGGCGPGRAGPGRSRSRRLLRRAGW